MLCDILAILDISFHFTNIFFNIFSDFTIKARLEVENGRIFLAYNGHKFIRYGSNDNKRYWRCIQSFKYHCNARILTKIMNGCEMLKIQHEEHDHLRLRKMKAEPK